MAPLARSLGAEPTSISFAAANDPVLVTADLEKAYSLFVIRVPGTAPGALLEAYREQALAAEGSAATASDTTVAGIPAVLIGSPAKSIPRVWFWALGDVLFGVQTALVVDAERLAVLLPAELPPFDATMSGLSSSPASRIAGSRSPSLDA